MVAGLITRAHEAGAAARRQDGGGRPMSTVTGRTYTVTRPRGFAPWRPRRDTLGLLDTIRGVLAEYDDQLPLTARQVFYRLVGAHGYDKTEGGL